MTRLFKIVGNADTTIFNCSFSIFYLNESVATFCNTLIFYS